MGVEGWWKGPGSISGEGGREASRAEEDELNAVESFS